MLVNNRSCVHLLNKSRASSLKWWLVIPRFLWNYFSGSLLERRRRSLAHTLVIGESVSVTGVSVSIGG